jgi:hypothetical protein
MSTEICNQALGRIGAKRINDYDDDTDTKPEAIQCRLHYAQTRDALQRSHLWVFNKGRVQLSRDTATPAFEYDYQFLLPSDYLRARYIYDANSGTHNALSWYSHSLETKSDGTRVLLIDTSDTTINFVYSRRITDAAVFDALYIELLVLKLAKKLVTPLSGGNKNIMREIKDDLNDLEPRVRALDRNEGMGTRRDDQAWWNDARQTSWPRSQTAFS